LRIAAGAAALIEHVSVRLRGEGAAVVRVGERDVELARPVLVEEAKQAGGRAAEMAAVEGNLARNG
jgi:hypothetical protein